MVYYTCPIGAFEGTLAFVRHIQANLREAFYKSIIKGDI